MAEQVPDMPDISHISLSGRPLIISDVDDVILEFVAPYQKFLESRAMKFIPRSFKLLGNIVMIEDEVPVDEAAIQKSLHDFFSEQHIWQQPFEHVLATLGTLSREADIVFLTAMPPQYAEVRRKHLDALGLPFPMIATEAAKGPVAARLHGVAGMAPAAFVDDMAHNLVSVAEHIPDCLLISLAPPSEVHGMAPPAPDAAVKAANWFEASGHIRNHFKA